MASMRAGLEEYLLRGLLILIVSSQLCCSTPITTPSPKPTEFLSKNFTVNATSTRQRKQNISTVEISQTSAVTLLPSIALESRKNSSAVHLEKRGCSRKRDGCPRFVDKYSSFYLKVGMKIYIKFYCVVTKLLVYQKISNMLRNAV